MTNATPKVDVLVVGAGPVGLVAACEMARRNVAVRIIDQRDEPTDQSRAIVIHPRSLEMLQRVGVVDKILDAGIKALEMRMFASGKQLARIGFDGVDSAFQFSATIAQTDTEAILTERLRELGVTIQRGQKLTGLSQDAEAAHVTMQSSSGDIEHLDATWVIGADGGHSSVRDLVGTRLAGSFKGERFVLGDVEARHDLDPTSIYTYFSAAGPLLVFPMPGQRMRLMAQIDSAGPANPNPTQELLQQLVDERNGHITITSSHWLTEFEIHHAQVPAYRFGRAFLAGDAAHIHSPAGGQGMNTGMQDAFNLAWKLAFAVNGQASDTLLDSYHAERHPVAAKVIEFSTRLTKAGTVSGRLPIAVRNHAVHALTALDPIRDAIADETEEVALAYRHSPISVDAHPHRAKVKAGDHLPPVGDPALQKRLDGAIDVYTEPVILTFAPAATAPVLGKWPEILVTDQARSIDGYAEVVLDPGHLLAERLGLARGGRVVLRPDGYIGCVASLDPAQVTDYLNLLTSRS